MQPTGCLKPPPASRWTGILFPARDRRPNQASLLTTGLPPQPTANGWPPKVLQPPHWDSLNNWTKEGKRLTSTKSSAKKCSGIDTLGWEWPPPCLTPRYYRWHTQSSAQGRVEGKSGHWTRAGEAGWGQGARGWESKQTEYPSKRGGRREDHVEAEVPSPQCLFQLSHWTSLLKYKFKDKIIKNTDNDCRAFDPKCEVLSAGPCVTTLIVHPWTWP